MTTIDIHAHMMDLEVYAATVGHSVFGKATADPSLSPEARDKARERSDFVCATMSDATRRLAEMDRMGVDVQVLTASLVHVCTYWAEPEESLRLDRRLNDTLATMVATNPRRLIGLGTVPLHAPQLAAREAERCMRELKLRGFNISTTARDMEIGDRRLWPFWEKAAEHDAVVYIHPAGNPGPRFEKHFLWNSVGQNFEESMAIASLMYEGVLETFPNVKICISHGGGYMPLCMGRVSRNYLEKPTTRANMKKSPDEYLRQLYYDSCVYDHDVLRNLVEKVGASQVILGSDYPVGETKPIEFVRDTPGISDADKDKIIGGNAAKMFGFQS
ncbi:MAG TPA: amidohydrolase family protein [Xanthobacteraceae bacterium]|jgi:aminocarboxymuconate-semialdehyde decarboxylase